MVNKAELNRSFHFSSFNIILYFIYTDLISLFEPRLVDPGSILIHFGAQALRTFLSSSRGSLDIDNSGHFINED